MAKGRKEYEFIRTNINIPKKIRERINDYAYDFGITISSASVILLKTALDNYEIMQNMKDKKEQNESTK